MPWRGEGGRPCSHTLSCPLPSALFPPRAPTCLRGGPRQAPRHVVAGAAPSGLAWGRRRRRGGAPGPALDESRSPSAAS